MRTMFTFKQKLSKSLAIIAGVFLLSTQANAQDPLRGGTTYVINGSGVDLVAPKDTFANLSGAYTGGSYTNTTGFFNALNVNGVDPTTVGTITVLLVPGYTGVEAQMIQVGNPTTGAYNFMSALRPIIVRPSSGNSVVITTSTGLAANTSLIRFNGAGFVTFDGETTPGSRNLTLRMSTTSTQITSKVIEFNGVGQNGTQNVTIRNCNIIGQSTTAAVNTYAGVYIGGTATPSNAIRRSQNIRIENNRIEAVRHGVYARGIQNLPNNHDLGLTVINNTIGGDFGPGSGQNITFIGGVANAAGIVLMAQANSNIEGNTIRNSMANFGGFRAVELSTIGGQSLDSNIIINGNKIYNLVTTVGSQGVYGIRANLGNTLNVPRNIIISNNTIGKIFATTPSIAHASLAYAVGFAVEDFTTNGGYTFIHNTIHMTGDTMANGGISACVATGPSFNGGLDIRNNIFSNTSGRALSANLAPTFGFGFIINGANRPFSVISNNAYHMNTTRGGLSAVGFSFNKPRFTVAEWAQYAQSTNEIRVIPTFIATGNDTTLVMPANIGSIIATAGVGGLVSADINGTPRTANPTIGAQQLTQNNATRNYPLNGNQTYPINGTSSWPVGVSGSGSFATVADAIHYLNHYGVTGTGQVRLEIQTGYTGEIAAVPALIDFPGAALTRPAVLGIASGVNATISTPAWNTHNYQSAFRILGARHFRINGSGTPGQRNLTFELPANANNVLARVISIASTDTAPSNNIWIQNTNIIGNSTPTAINTFAGIYFGAYNPNGLSNQSSALGNNNEFQITNNFIQAVRNGVYVRGANLGGAQNRLWNISRNIIGGDIAPSQGVPTTFIGGNINIPTEQSGIMLKAVAESTIDSNVIRNTIGTGTSSNLFAGIRLESFGEQGVDSALNIWRNTIYNLTTQGQAIYGVRVSLLNANQRFIRMINNSIAKVTSNGAGTPAAPTNPSAVFLDVTGGQSNNFGFIMYFNTINMVGTQLTNNSASNCVYVSANIVGGLDFRNNIFNNSLGRASGAGNAYGINILSNQNPFQLPQGNSLFNLYSVNAPNSNNILGVSQNTALPYTTLSAWQTFTGSDLGSIAGNAIFANDSTPDLDLALAGPAQGSGIPIPGVATDIYGTARPVNAVCIGAVEFVSPFSRLQGGATYLINGVQNPPQTSNPTSGSFATINRAIQYLNANGVDEFTPPAQPITLLITTGYLGEGDTLITPLTSYPRMNANRIVTLKPDAGRNDTISIQTISQLGNNGSLFRFQGGSFFVIDGSNNGTNSRNLTFRIPAGATNTTLKVIDLTAGNTPVTNVAIRNCNIVGNSSTSAINTFAGIYMGGVAITPSNPTSGSNNNNRFENNFIGAVRYGIYLRGNGLVGQQDRNAVVSRNIIGGSIAPGGATPTDFFGGIANAAGILLAAQGGSVIDSNIIRNNIPTGFNSISGIELSTVTGTAAVDSGITISRNRIYNIRTNQTAAYGIRMNFANQGFRNTKVLNNAISRIHAVGTASTGAVNINNPFGILLEGLGTVNDIGVEFYYNSIFVGNANVMNANATSSAIYITNNITGGIRLRNNILQNSLGATSGASNTYSLLTGSNLLIFDLNDNNSYFTGGTNTNNRLFGRNASGVPNVINTLGDLRAFTAMDTFSMTAFAAFVNDTNLLLPNPTNSQLKGSGNPIPGVTTDMLGIARPIILPNIGAHEFTGNYVDSIAPRVFNVASATGCAFGPINIALRVIERNIASDTLYYRINGGNESFALNTSNVLFTRSFTIPQQGPNSTVEYRYSVNDGSSFAHNTRFPESGYLSVSTIFDQYPLTFGFDEPNTQGWATEQVSGVGGWDLETFGSGNLPILGPQTGIRAALFPSASLPAGTTSRLISPCLDLSGMQQPTLRFWMSQNADLPNLRDSVTLMVSIAGSPWFPTQFSFPRVNTSLAFPTFSQFDVCLSDYIGVIGLRFALQAVSRGGNNIVLDSIVFFDDLVNLAVTPNPALVCDYDSIRVTLANTSNTYSYQFINILNPVTPLGSTRVGNNGNLQMVGWHNNEDSLLIRFLYTNLLSGCSNLMRDTVRVIVPKFTNGPFLVPGTAFDGSFGVGSFELPDGSKPGDVLTYQINPPSGLTNAQYSTAWTVVNVSAQTENGASPASAVFSPPGGGQNARYVITPSTANDDSLYRITITVRLLPSNCDSVFVRWLKVTTPPTAGITVAGPSTFCALTPRTFINTSAVPTQTLPATFEWNFGDGTITNSFNGEHSFRTAGNYTVRLTVTNKFGLTSTTTTSVTVLEAPTVAFTNSQPCAASATTFTSNVPSNTDSVRWEFRLGGNLVGVNTNFSTNFNFPTGDTSYSIRLRAINSLGCANDTTQSFFVFPRVVANFDASQHCAGTVMPIVNNTTIISNRQNNSYGSEWDFGNGQTGLANIPTYRFPTGGTYNVKLKVTTNFGCTDSLIKQVTVLQAPAVDFVSANSCQFDEIGLTNNTTFSGGLDAVRFTWNFGDNSPLVNLANPSKVFGAVGTYQIKLSAVDTINGCRDSLTKAISINAKPFAAFNVNPQNCLGSDIPFSNVSNAPTGQTLTYAWNFGDNSPVSTDANPTHRYTTSGTFDVSMIVTTDRGCSDTASREVASTEPPAVTFTSVPLNPDASPWQITFTATPSGLASYRWNFGDGRVGQGATIEHSYTRRGEYNVTLTVSDANGCSRDLTQSVFVVQGLSFAEAFAKSIGFTVAPNPFTEVAKLGFTLENPADVKVEVYDMMGRRVANYDTVRLIGGSHTLEINENDLKAKASTYMIKVTIDDMVITRTLLYSK
jgi:PKD repeat protein